MTDTTNNVIDARLQEALGQYFNGVALKHSFGDCAILAGIRKQNGAPVDIYTPSFAVVRDSAARADIAKQFENYEKLSSNRLQSPERLLTSRAFKKSPALAVLSCPVPVFDEAFDTLQTAAKLQIFGEILDGLARLHGAGIVHGNLAPTAVRREDPEGGLRLCDFTFCGDRTTQVISQQTAYQSRHVINNSQPRLIDDVHAAGMLGYRILLGQNGAEKVLTGFAETDDKERIVSAILGEETAASTAEELFPEGHASGDQIARLLARMTGRLANSTAYSSAETAQKAFQSVITNPSKGLPSSEPATDGTPDVTTSNPANPQPTLNPGKPGGVSKATAVVLFSGFLVSTAAAVYFYSESNQYKDRLITAAGRFVAQSENLEETRSAAEQSAAQVMALTEQMSATNSANLAMRQADALVTEARLAGAAVASSTSARNFENAITSMSGATVALETGDAAGAVENATIAGEAAQNALDNVAQISGLAITARGQATKNQAMANTAGATGRADYAAALDLLVGAKVSFGSNEIEAAANSWIEASRLFETAFGELQIAAETARVAVATAQSDVADRQGQATYILAVGLKNRGDAAFETQAYGDAADIYTTAIEAFAKESAAITASPQATPRQVSFGDSAEQIAQAVEICRTDAPIDPSSCPAIRHHGETVKEQTLTPYELDATEVSAAKFARFIADTSYVTEAETEGRIVALTSSGEARFIDGDYTWATPNGKNTTWESAPELPAMNISMKDAVAYCSWASARLPSEAEWEYAARGETARSFPWGEWSADAPIWRGAPTADHRLPQTVETAGGATSTGLAGLSGNVHEWVLAHDGAVLKGGSWNTANPADLRISARVPIPNNAPGVDFGFRCARDLEAWK